MSPMPMLIVLAGGVSSRMWPLREKSLLRFGPDPLLVAQLRRYLALGFREAIIVGNPENREAIASMTAQVASMQIQVVVQAESKGMGDAILQTAPILEDRRDTPVYITQVHDVVDDALHRAMLAASEQDSRASYLAGCEMETYFPGGYLVVDADGRINRIVEKPGPENRPGNLVSIVAHFHRDSGLLFEAIRAEYAREVSGDDHYERAMDTLMKSQVYRVAPYRGHWSAIKYPWHVLSVMDYFLAQIQGQNVAWTATISNGATLIGNVLIGENAKVFPGAAVVGPAYIGAGTIVGNNALVRSSMVLDGCEVGFTTEIARSYVAEGCSMHACRVLDSVFAPGVNFSAGCTTANLRIDRGEVSSMVKGEKLGTGRNKFGAVIGRDAFLGVDVMTMPGVKIGERAQIGPGTHVHRDVKDGQRVYVKQELVVEEEE